MPAPGWPSHVVRESRFRDLPNGRRYREWRPPLSLAGYGSCRSAISMPLIVATRQIPPQRGNSFRFPGAVPSCIPCVIIY